MQAGEIYLVFTERLRELGLDYVVTGSVASSSYGEPRFTHDIDLVLALPRDAVEDLWKAFPVEEFYCPPTEVLRAEAERGGGGHFNLVHHESGFKADVYVAADDELTTWAMTNAREIEVQSGKILRLAPPEFVILGKLQFYSEGGGERHVRDIRAMHEVAGDDIDAELLSRWVRRLGLEDTWSRVREG